MQKTNIKNKTFLTLQYNTLKGTVIQYNSWHTGDICIFKSSQLENSYVRGLLCYITELPLSKKWWLFMHKWTSLVAQGVTNLPAMQETRVRSLDWEGPLEEGPATHSSILAWRIAWTEGPGRLVSGSAESDVTEQRTHTCMKEFHVFASWSVTARFICLTQKELSLNLQREGHLAWDLTHCDILHLFVF